MFRVMRGGTVIGRGLKIKGDVSAEGLVEVNGEIQGDVHCTSLVVSPSTQIVGSVTAERVVVNGKVRVQFKAATWCLNQKRMWWVIFVTNHSRSRRGPTSKAARHKLREPTVANPTRLQGFDERPVTPQNRLERGTIKRQGQSGQSRIKLRTEMRRGLR
jgi:hypothetical protein